MKSLCGFAFILHVLSIGVSYAGESSYACKVIHVYELDDNGALRASNWEKQFKGSKFTILRIDGQITGEVVPTLLAKSTHVHNRGDKENSFKASADFGNQYQLIEVQEFKKGNQKPFIAMSLGGAGIVTGMCK